MTSTKKRIAAALTATILSATLAIPTMATETPTIRVSSYKGSTLEVGERSGLIIGPAVRSTPLPPAPRISWRWIRC